jgi:pseudouridine kinase
MRPAGFVLALGGANLDINAGADHELRPGDSTPGRVHFSPGGVARNVAENLARLGHDSRLFSAVGDDPQGLNLLAQTRHAGVDVSGCWLLPGVATASYVSVHDSQGDMAVAVNDMQILEHITPERLQPHAQQIRQAAALVLDCNLSEAAMAWLFANHGSAPVFVDAVSAFKCARVRPWLGQVHTLKVNRLEAQALCGLPVGSSNEVESAARCLLGLGVRRVVLSLGEQGLYYSEHGGQSGWQAALPVNVVHASGAGDALMAGLVHSFLANEPLARAVRFAGACATLTLTVASANHPELSEALVEQTLQSVAAR